MRLRVRIKKIEICELFDTYNHTIELNQEKQLNIIYGINGIGKTMLFKILDSFFNLKFNKLLNAPFKKLTVTYEDGTNFKLLNEKSSLIVEFNALIPKNNKKVVHNRDDNTVYIKKIETEYNIKKIGNDKFINNKTKEILSYEEVINQYHFDKPATILLPTIKISEISDIITSRTNSYFIGTQRLLTFNKEYEKNLFQSMNLKSDLKGGIKNESIIKYSDELAKIIRNKHSEYADLSSKLENTLGSRLVKKEIKTISNKADLIEENKALQDKKDKLKSVGLLKEVDDDTLMEIKDFDDLTMAVLSVNIQDMKNKYKIFDDLYNRLNLFLDILNNKRLSNKKMFIDSKMGFLIRDSKNELLDITDLSSGEQHEIVMFYELLFKVKDNSLVLIDEPEISLHIAWQKEFIEDMYDIIKIKNFNILIATHSPAIIDGNWDLTVELEKLG